MSDIATEHAKRDTALDLLETHRANLICLGRAFAIAIHDREKRVTSEMVRREMRMRGHDVDTLDPRWLGAVFRKGWKRLGYEPTGSHGRPVAIWGR